MVDLQFPCLITSAAQEKYNKMIQEEFKSTEDEFVVNQARGSNTEMSPQKCSKSMCCACHAITVIGSGRNYVERFCDRWNLLDAVFFWQHSRMKGSNPVSTFFCWNVNVYHFYTSSLEHGGYLPEHYGNSAMDIQLVCLP